MPDNHHADIHQYTWYQTRKGQKYLCTRASYTWNPETKQVEFTCIELLEFLTCEPKEIAYATMVEWLETGALVVVKRAF